MFLWLGFGGFCVFWLFVCVVLGAWWLLWLLAFGGVSVELFWRLLSGGSLGFRWLGLIASFGFW